ncbi:MAG: prepilin-type N-terminal cleavage/methylation domain-containing protein [Chloroflexi bacterium]|nr:prepilin-type N-terminal cleavage/methylation domain-containing protein [Chloroflexota bacterium]
MSPAIIRPARRAFTLIELLVVIAIIAILAAILLPVFAQARSKARQAVGTSNAKQVATAILMYVQDYDETYPRTGWNCVSDTNSPPQWINQCGGNDWTSAIGPYDKSAGVFTSPGDASSVAGWGWGAPGFQPDDGNESLLMNDMLSHTSPTTSAGYADPNNQNQEASGLSLASVKSPADCVLLSEGHCGWQKTGPYFVQKDWTGSTDVNNKWHQENSMSGFQTWLIAGRSYSNWGNVIPGVPFYNNGGIVAFTDGHVRYVKMTDDTGMPIVCSTLPWPKHMDPQQRNADLNSCTDSANMPGSGPANWN